jgi:hypothetical protein
MRIGVAKEIKSDEYRVALTPAGALELINNGHEVAVETGAGLGSSFSDESYERVGVQITSVDDVWARSDLVLKVKEPIAAEYGRMREGQILFTYLHIAADELELLGLLRSCVALLEVCCDEQVDLLVREARRREERRDLHPLPAMKAGLLAELAPRALERRLSVLAQAGGQLEHLPAHRGPRLTDEGHLALADGNDRHGIVVLDDLQAVLADDVEDPSFEDDLAVHAAACSRDG